MVVVKASAYIKNCRARTRTQLVWGCSLIFWNSQILVNKEQKSFPTWSRSEINLEHSVSLLKDLTAKDSVASVYFLFGIESSYDDEKVPFYSLVLGTSFFNLQAHICTLKNYTRPYSIQGRQG